MRKLLIEIVIIMSVISILFSASLVFVYRLGIHDGVNAVKDGAALKSYVDKKVAK